MNLGERGAEGGVATTPNPGYLVAGTDASVYQEALGDSDLSVAAIVLKPTGTARGGVLLRGIDDQNYIAVAVTSDDQVQVLKREGGLFFELASTPLALAAEIDLEARITGNIITVHVQGTRVLIAELEGVDAETFGTEANPIPTRVGLYSSEVNGPRFYRFEARSLATATVDIFDGFGRAVSATLIGGDWIVQSGTWGIEQDAVEHVIVGRVTHAGSPEGVISAPVGTLYTRTDGGAGTTFYVKESGTGNTGWTAQVSGGVTAGNDPIASLTDNTGGTADDTLEDIAPVPAAGINEAAERAATNDRLTRIENNFADLAAKVNAVLTELRDSGLINP